MPTSLAFTKMHGIGNDYVYVNLFDQPPLSRPADLARRLSDRRFGVGSDGLILLLPPGRGVNAHVRMRMFNADGSEGAMCGNGIRCVCKLARERGISTANPMRVQTPSGVLQLRYRVNARGEVTQVTVDMGQPVLQADLIPVKYARDPQVIDAPMRDLLGAKNNPGPRLDLPLLERELHSRPGSVSMTCLSMGNPHVVIFLPQIHCVALDRVGPVIERARIFPHRVNVHLARVLSRSEMAMRTWERGSGITLACGTGAAAVCVAGVLTNRTGRKLLIHLPGGDLKLRWDAKTGHVFKTGPAEIVFDGLISINPRP